MQFEVKPNQFQSFKNIDIASSMVNIYDAFVAKIALKAFSLKYHLILYF